MWGISVLAGLLVTSASLLWAGFFAVLLHQAYHFARTMLKVWTIATQFDCWHANKP